MGELSLMSSLEKRLAEVVKKERPDIIHVHSPILNALPALRIGKKSGIPVVYEIRALWEDAAVDHGTYKQCSWKYTLVRFLETFSCKRANHVLVLSQGLKDDFIERGVPAEKLTVVGNGVDPKQFEQNVAVGNFQERWGMKGKQIVGFIGSFYRYEGLDLLVDAVAHLSTRWPALALLLVGGGEVENELRKKIHDLRLDDRVIIPGRIPHDDVPSIYKLIDILVYPRRSMRLTEIVTPLKPLEAMAMGKALIASNVGGHRELISDEETGLLFRPGDVRALVAQLERLLANNELRIKLGGQAASWVRRERSWKKLIGAHVEVYGRILGNRPSSRVDYKKLNG